MSFGARKAITDKYGQKIEVNVDEGDAEVVILVDAVPSQLTTEVMSLAPDDADNLADQLRAAAAHARTLTPHE